MHNEYNNLTVDISTLPMLMLHALHPSKVPYRDCVDQISRLQSQIYEDTHL